MLDILITNGTVFNGSREPGRSRDVGVTGDRLTLYGRGEGPEAHRVIDAAGRMVCPGFVDPHSHSDMALLVLPDLHDKILQGVTTEVIGNCGISPFPVGSQGDRPRHEGRRGEELLREVLKPVAPGDYPITWADAAGFLAEVDRQGADANYMSLLGHGSLRAAVVGTGDGDISPGELTRMLELLRQAFEQGVSGLSFGLLYPPGCYAGSAELAALAAAVADAGGVVACHIRNYTDHLLPSLQEMLDVADGTHVRLRISHLMAANVETAGRALTLLHDTAKRGVDVSYDQYPYERGMTSLQALLPPWLMSGGAVEMLRRLKDKEVRRRAAHDIGEGIAGWDSLIHSVGSGNVSLLEPGGQGKNGLSLADISQQRGQDAASCLFDLLLETGGTGMITMRLTTEEAIRTLMRDDLGCVSTDGLPRKGLTHPRTFGTFARVLGCYCRDERVLEWSEAIRRCTSVPAERFGIRERGTLEDGYFADVVVFTPESVADRATYLKPASPQGIEFVIVNGKVAVENGQPTGVKAGRRLVADRR